MGQVSVHWSKGKTGLPSSGRLRVNKQGLVRIAEFSHRLFPVYRVHEACLSANVPRFVLFKIWALINHGEPISADKFLLRTHIKWIFLPGVHICKMNYSPYSKPRYSLGRTLGGWSHMQAGAALQPSDLMGKCTPDTSYVVLWEVPELARHSHICGFIELLYFLSSNGHIFSDPQQQTEEKAARKTINPKKKKKEHMQSWKGEHREFEIWRPDGKQKMNHVWEVSLAN